MNTREKVLKEALNCVNGEREKQYGNPEDNFRRIADLWSVYLTSLFEGETVVIEINPIDVAKMMILFKIARSNGDLDKLDNYVDIIGYGACAAEILEKDMEFSYSDPYSEYHDKLAEYVSYVANRKHIQLDNLKSINRKFPRELEELLDQESTDCAINGKRLFDCYREIDELFDKYDIPDKSEDKEVSDIIKLDFFIGRNSHSYWKMYDKISKYILSSSVKANISQFDVIDCLIKNGHAPSIMTALIMTGKLSFDDWTAYVDDAINELNTFYDDKLKGIKKGSK